MERQKLKTLVGKKIVTDRRNHAYKTWVGPLSPAALPHAISPYLKCHSCPYIPQVSMRLRTYLHSALSLDNLQVSGLISIFFFFKRSFQITLIEAVCP